MLDASRRAVCVFRLRLPRNDKLDKLWFPQLATMPHWNKRALTRLDGDVFARHARKIPGTIMDGLTEFAPYLFMSPFFDGLTGLAGGAKCRKIREMAEESFSGESPPPYCFTKNNDGVIVHPEWARYFSRNAEIINAWIMWKLAQYIQQINPSTPGITAKLDDTCAPNTVRAKKFWRRVIEIRPGMSCIYTGKPISADDFVLDHYIPWSFVAHDNMWNLVPVSEAGNVEKSDNLPSVNAYFEDFADMQNLGIESLHAFPDKKTWEDLFEPYLTDLNIDAARAVVDGGDLERALAGVINPLLTIAKTRGFTPDWEFGGN